MRLRLIGLRTQDSNSTTCLRRRDFCRQLLLASSMPLLTGCATAGAMVGRGRGEAALLLPTSGPSEGLGENLARAASLAASPDVMAPRVYDTGDTDEGARIAARKAVDDGARVLFGPLRASQTPAVLAEAGEIPVVTFSNDDRLAQRGAFVMGVTPAQSVAATFSYARSQGITRVAVLARSGPLGVASAEAARGLAAGGGLTLTAALLRDDTAGATAALRDAGGGTLPEAVFLPEGGPELVEFARALTGSGIRLMGGVQWGVVDVASEASLEGAWFASPSPNAFAEFRDAFEPRFGEPAGIVAALGHDAALTAAVLSRDNAMNRAGLTRSEGFTGALGRYRFQKDGRCQRDLAVLTIENGQIIALGEVTDT